MPTEVRTLHYEGNLDRLLEKCSEEFTRVEVDDRYKYKLELKQEEELYSIVFHYLGGCCIRPRPANYYDTVVTIKGPDKEVVLGIYEKLEKELDINFKEGPQSWEQMVEVKDKLAGVLNRFKSQNLE
jgi:hypothetical protein